MIDLRFLDTFCSLFPDRLGGLNSRGLLGGFLRDRRLKRAGKHNERENKKIRDDLDLFLLLFLEALRRLGSLLSNNSNLQSAKKL